MAATSWDRKVTVWLDYSEDSGTVTPYMQMQGQDSDILSVAFTYPKSLAAACADGSVGVFDIESGYKKMSLVVEKLKTGRTPRDTKAALGNTQYIEKIIFLEKRNGTLVSAGADGNLRFWEGQWMPSVPPHCNTSVTPFKLACLVPANHFHGSALVDVKCDDENNFLVSADEAGFIKSWDISGYDWKKPRADQVEPISFWQAHQVGINTIDIMVPSNVEDDVEEEMQPLVFSSASDKCAMLWTIDGSHVGKFGQPLQGRSVPWDLYDRKSWVSPESLNIFGGAESALGSPMSRESDSDSSDDEESFNAILNDLDERLRAKAPGKSKLNSNCFALDEVPAEAMSKIETKKKGKDYEVDEITGERIYKTANKKTAVGEEKKKAMNGYMKLFTKKLDQLAPEVFLSKTPGGQGGAHEDPKEAEMKVIRATASTLMKVYDHKMDRLEWVEPDAAQKDLLCTKIRHSLQTKRDPDADVDKIAKYLNKLGNNWDEMLSQADPESLA